MLRALLLLLPFALAVPALAQQPAERPDPMTDPEAHAVVREVEAYFNTVRTLRSDLRLRGPGGEFGGRLYLDRPNARLRMDFDPPLGDRIIARGDRVRYSRGGIRLSADMRETPIYFILADPVVLGDDVRVLQVSDRGERVVVAVDQRSRPDQGQVVLHFRRGPALELTGWGVFDADGDYLSMELVNPEPESFMPDGLFILED